MLRLVIVAVLLLVAPVSRAQDRPSVRAGALSQAPVIDGDVRNDPAWTTVPAVSRFTQTAPDDGQPASERTEVRIGFTASSIYVGVILFDSEPDRLIMADRRRDASLEESDSFQFILDTFGDGQNGFIFGTTPAGVEYDAQFIGTPGGGASNRRMSGGASGGLNVNWDASWTVATSVHEDGWSAEFEIPFRTLRYPRADEAVWGINFQRNVRRRNETAFWATLPRQFGLTRVSLAGRLEDLLIEDTRNLKVLPYVLGSAQGDFEPDPSEHRTRFDAGFDLKYSLTPGLTLDATLNTDFAQVEVDEEQINLDRFSLFFPEKRPFFLENAGLFAVGASGEVDLFFSRRIGIADDGSSVPIVGGVRLSGTAGQYRIGVLEMQTESTDDLPGNNFAVARLSRDLPNRSSVGLLVTNRAGTGAMSPAGDRNFAAAVDAKWGIGQNGLVSGFISRTDTPGLTGNATAGQLLGTYESESFTVEAGYTEVAEAFNPEVGFLRRSNYRKYSGSLFHRYRPRDLLSLQELRPHTNYRAYWGRDGFQETGYWHIDNHWEFRSGDEIHTGVNLTLEGVREPFEIADGVTVPADTYVHREISLVFLSSDVRPISASLRVTSGGFFGGDRLALFPSLNIRSGERLSTGFTLGHTRGDLPGGEFTTNLFRARISYSFTPRIYLQALGQYNDQSDQWSANIRFGWLQDANTGLFVVFNQLNRIDGLPGEPMQRGVTIKYAHLFDLLD